MVEYKQLRSQKWATDEIVGYWIETILFIVFYPVFMLLKVRKIHFASIFNTPISRRLQTLSISTIVLLFLAGAQLTFGAVVGILLFSRYWYVIAIYLTHYFLDADKPENGSRPIWWVRDNPIWRYARDYFPITLIKDPACNLDPCKNYLFAFHPHGVLSLSSILSFAANHNDFKDMFHGMCSYMCALPVWFQVPFFREFLMGAGGIPSTRKSIKNMLRRPDGGNCVTLIVGGSPESLLSRPGDVRLYLKKRYGFIKIALQEGSPVVPVFAFGEHQLYEQDDNPKGSMVRWFQDTVQKFTGGITFPAFHGRGVLQYDIGMIPYRRPVFVVVGKPLQFDKIENPNHDEVAKSHDIYIKELTLLFDKYKGQYMTPNTQLIIE